MIDNITHNKILEYLDKKITNQTKINLNLLLEKLFQQELRF